jgi:hypothetical protein
MKLCMRQEWLVTSHSLKTTFQAQTLRWS